MQEYTYQLEDRFGIGLDLDDGGHARAWLPIIMLTVALEALGITSATADAVFDSLNQDAGFAATIDALHERDLAEAARFLAELKPAE